MPVVLHECEIYAVTLRQEYRLTGCENRVPSKMFGPKMEEVTRAGESFIMTSKEVRWAWRMVYMGHKKNAHRALVEES